MTSQQCFHPRKANETNSKNTQFHITCFGKPQDSPTRKTPAIQETPTLNPEPRQSKLGFTTCSHIYLVGGKLNPSSNAQTHPASNKHYKKQTTQTDITMGI
mgnify:CR=1 FL=1|jgi:hypothetical protein